VYDSGLSWTPVRAADFNGDGKADILWQNTDGSLAIWLMNGGASLGGAQIY
jgi:membrane-bound lytic murein transglycosylase B